MHFSAIEAIDLFLRSSAVGQLILICVLYLHRPITGQKLSLLGIAICTAAYLLLTAPIPNVHYGALRNILLVFTDALPYTIWLAALYFFEDDFAPQRWPLPVKVGASLFLLWHISFFGFMDGSGVFHDISHGIAIALLVHVLYVAVRGLNGDLVNKRRKTRVLIAVVVSIFGIYLALNELFGDLRQTWLFGLSNALFIFLSITILARYLLSEPATASDQGEALFAAERQPGQVHPKFRALKQKLEDFMDNGGYRQTGLTIKELAAQLSCPEHHLRRFINTTLGFRNFSAFLNSRRIRDACAQLADQDQSKTPILTIALGLGYGSIGPFNRAFKAETGLTPKEYRHSFQNQP